MLSLVALMLVASGDVAHVGEFVAKNQVAVALVAASEIPAKHARKVTWVIDYSAINAAPPVISLYIRSNNQVYNHIGQTIIADEAAPKVKELKLATVRAKHKAWFTGAGKHVKVIEATLYGSEGAKVEEPRTAQMSLGFLADGSAPVARTPTRADAQMGAAAVPQLSNTLWTSSF